MDIYKLHKILESAGIPVISVSEDGKVEFDETVTIEQKNQAVNIIQNYDPNEKTIEEVQEELAKQSIIDFENIPDWATWNPKEASDFITNQIFNAQTKEQVDTWIDSNVTTIAQSKVALKNVAGEVIKIRGDLEKLAQLIILIRNIVIRGNYG